THDIVPFGRFIRRDLDRHLHLGKLGAIGGIARFEPHATMPVQHTMSYGGKEMCANGISYSPMLPPFPKRHEHISHQLFRNGRVASQTGGVSMKIFIVGVEELCEGRVITRPNPRNERRIIIADSLIVRRALRTLEPTRWRSGIVTLTV